MKKLLKILAGFMILAVIGLATLLHFLSPQGWQGKMTGLFDQTPLDKVTPVKGQRPAAAITAAKAAQDAAASTAGESTVKQILWGDTHVHTTYSFDAFYLSMPFMHGSRGAFPPAFACDYARYVSQLDFYVLTDHAEAYTPETWADQVASIRHCNDLAGDPQNPDLVAFLGWEWSQVGNTAEEHYGHHNVVLRDTGDANIPSRPIGASGLATETLRIGLGQSGVPRTDLLDPLNAGYHKSMNQLLNMMAATPDCPTDIASPDLPAGCYESVATPAELYKKLREWGSEAQVIPHGTTWGFYTPPEASWDHYMADPDNIDPEMGRLIEIYSGHGNSEEYSDIAAIGRRADGSLYCPEPTSIYVPSCWQVGTILKQRCLAKGKEAAICDDKANTIRQMAADMRSAASTRLLYGPTLEEMLDAGQPRDVPLPAFNYRPKKSAQYGLALNDPTRPEGKDRFRWGFIASTDTHTARAGHGFKQLMRQQATEAAGTVNEYWRKLTNVIAREEASDDIRPIDEINAIAGFSRLEQERQSSFFTLGGIMAVHSAGRDRNAIWDAMVRREVYGTTGHRILLWFNQIDADGKAVANMGAIRKSADDPVFRVRAVGSFKQLPGCPAWVTEQLAAKHLEKLADNECYNPGNERYRIEKIDVIRIRPQQSPDEDPADLIDRNWRQFDCPPDPNGCEITFTDPDFTGTGRDAIYYVRAIEEAISTVNAANLRPQNGTDGQVSSVQPCYGDHRLTGDTNCLSPIGQRAWSSPIFMDFDAGKQTE